MNVKKLLVATSLALAAMGASATPLDSISGALNIKLVGLTTEVGTQGGSNETTWGVGAVTQIQGTGGQGWSAGLSDGTYLYYMLYGIADQNVVANGTGQDIYNIGATGGAADGKIHLDIYRTNTQIISIDSDFNANPAGRLGFSSYNLLNALGPAYLKLTFGAGKQLVNVTGGSNLLADETLATLVQQATATNLPADGKGSFFADVAGGTAAGQWDTNGQFGHDFDGKYTLSTNGAQYGSGTCTPGQAGTAPVLNPTNGTITPGIAGDGTCFTGLINDPIRANKLPEPGSLALFGLALAGLAGARSRKNKK